MPRRSPLTAALASAYANNPEILAAYIDAQASAEDIVSAKAGKLPVIGASGKLTDTYSIASGTTANSLGATYGLSYSQTLLDNGQTDAAVEAKRAVAEAKVQAARDTEQSVLLSAAKAYISVGLNTRIAQAASGHGRLLRRPGAGGQGPAVGRRGDVHRGIAGPGPARQRPSAISRAP